MRSIRWFVASLLFLAFIPAALADTVVVRIPPGAENARLIGVVRGYDTDTFIIDARRGQQMTVDMRTGNGSAYFNILAPGGRTVFNGAIEGNSFSRTLSAPGRYRVQVYLMRNAARRGEVANYRLRVSIPAGDPGYDDGGGYVEDDGGPDNYIVSGVPAGDQLNIRIAPTPNSGLVARVRNGTVLRNLGCRTVGPTRWCQVATRLNDRGWANGRYLREY